MYRDRDAALLVLLVPLDLYHSPLFTASSLDTLALVFSPDQRRRKPSLPVDLRPCLYELLADCDHMVAFRECWHLIELR